MSPDVTIQPLAVGRAVRALNGLARYPRAGEGAHGTPYASGKALNSYRLINLEKSMDPRKTQIPSGAQEARKYSKMLS